MGVNKSRKVAIIGYGGMGLWHHEGINEHVPEFSVVGAYDVREEACAKAAQSGLKVYANFNEAISDAEIDIILIATPNDVHKDL